MVLAQNIGGEERLACCTSQMPNQTECNYSNTKKECLAVSWELRTFQHFLLGQPLEVYADHTSLQWLQSIKGGGGLLHHQQAELEEYQPTIVHWPGKLQGHVDLLS